MQARRFACSPRAADREVSRAATSAEQTMPMVTTDTRLDTRSNMVCGASAPGMVISTTV